MPAHSTRRSPSPPPGSRSLLSRLKSPFGSKTRHLAEYYIQPDDPHRQYTPGDIITGSVIVKVIRPVRVTHLTVSLHGYVQVYKNPNQSGDGYRAHSAPAGSKPKKAGYYGNGFARLFEDDEVVLCGEGRLGEGTYQFQFELQFPRSTLPTSIDFERGTITYMISSTITRPTTISPTTTCDRKVSFAEDVDIAPLQLPKPRIISLEPISRRSRTRHLGKRKQTASDTSNKEPNQQTTSGPESAGHSRVGAVANSQADSDVPQSPAPSDTSFDSCHSSCGGTGSAANSGTPSVKTTDSKLNNSTHNETQKSIRATIELQKAGVLPGDNVPLKILVNHTKYIKSVNGVIVTLYRQARIDMQPSLPIVSTGKENISDELYPTPRIGLSGLSLSSTGHSHVFRKDLSQSLASLIINPDTLTAEIKVVVSVPDEVFPTISCVPGAMVNFRYFVEVVLDLQGKVSGLDRFLPGAGLSNGLLVAKNGMTNGAMVAPWGGHLINTEDIRREKSVVCSNFEIIVGNRDSDRARGKQKVQDARVDETIPSHLGDREAQPNTAGDADQSETPYDHYYYPYNGGANIDFHQQGYYYDHYNYTQGYEQMPSPVRIPLPEILAEEELPEKERLRRAEARLLPSQPPDDDGSASHRHNAIPLLPAHLNGGQEAINDSVPVIAGPSAQMARADPPGNDTDNAPAPAYRGRAPTPGQAAPTDDKQELQRRILEMDRSAPDDYAEEEQAESSQTCDLGPSVPPLEEGEFGFRVSQQSAGDALGTHELPRYER